MTSSPSCLCWRLCAAALVLLLTEVRGLGEEVVYAVNCGGDAHVDSQGVRYRADPLRVGTASDYGRQLLIHRVAQQDQPLYQTERYHTSTFGYDIPVEEDGWYLLVLKFSEVYFNAPNMKVGRGGGGDGRDETSSGVHHEECDDCFERDREIPSLPFSQVFDVVLNGDLTVASDLDIYERVGRGVAHDEYVEFEVREGKILLDGDESELTRGKMRVEFIKVRSSSSSSSNSSSNNNIKRRRFAH